MTSRKLLSRGASALAAAAVAVLGLGTAAQAETAGLDSAPARVTITADAGIQAGGVGVAVRLDVRCPEGNFGYIYVETTQVRDGQVMTGSGSASPNCTGETESMWIGMPSAPADESGVALPFRLGKTFVSASMETCFDICEVVQDSRTLRLSTEVANDPGFKSPKLSFKLPRTGQFEAFGAGVVVEIPYTCAAGVQGYFYATLGQLTEFGTVTYSGDDLGLTCTETQRSGVLAFHARNAPWQVGQAFLTLGGEACDEFECVSASAFRTIKVAV